MMGDGPPTGVPRATVDCDCYKCIGPIYRWNGQHRYVYNNVHIERCDECGRIKTEHVDLGTKGYYECWWCNERAAGPFGPEAAPPTGGLA